MDTKEMVQLLKGLAQEHYEGIIQMGYEDKVEDLGLWKAALRLERLQEDSDWLQCLEAAGVDNWQGIEYAMELRDGS